MISHNTNDIDLCWGYGKFRISFIAIINTLAENIIIIWLDKWESRLILNANLIFIQI